MLLEIDQEESVRTRDKPAKNLVGFTSRSHSTRTRPSLAQTRRKIAGVTSRHHSTLSSRKIALKSLRDPTAQHYKSTPGTNSGRTIGGRLLIPPHYRTHSSQAQTPIKPRRSCLATREHYNTNPRSSQSRERTCSSCLSTSQHCHYKSKDSTNS